MACAGRHKQGRHAPSWFTVLCNTSHRKHMVSGSTVCIRAGGGCTSRLVPWLVLWVHCRCQGTCVHTPKLLLLPMWRRYLREKDHFERQYKKHLSKRLLANKAPNEGTALLLLDTCKRGWLHLWPSPAAALLPATQLTVAV